MNVYGSASGFSGPITALAAASPRLEVTIFGRRTSGPCGGRKEGPKRPCVAGTWNHKKPLSASACKRWDGAVEDSTSHAFVWTGSWFYAFT